MKMAVIYGAMAGFDRGLNKAVGIIEDTFTELGVDVETINLSVLDIPYYDGIKSSVVEGVFDKIDESDGIVFACVASLFAPCAVMQGFIEHFDFKNYKNVIKDKNCFTVITSDDGSEMRCEQYLSSIIPSLGGVVVNRLAIGSEYISKLGRDDEVKEMIEKYAEDYYRMLRQNRKFFHNNSFSPAAVSTTMANGLSSDEIEALKTTPKKVKAKDLLNGVSFDEFDKAQQEDIDELTKLLSKTYSSTKSSNNNNAGKQKTVSDLYKTNMMEMTTPVPHMKTCKQKTQSIIHYFQPQLAKDAKVIYQINIKGDEKFECYIEIKNGECEYYDGVNDEADVSIFAQSSDWNDMLNGKYTTQKGFMTGKLKVRGNFILLSKFDLYFKLQP